MDLGFVLRLAALSLVPGMLALASRRYGRAGHRAGWRDSRALRHLCFWAASLALLAASCNEPDANLYRDDASTGSAVVDVGAPNPLADVDANGSGINNDGVRDGGPSDMPAVADVSATADTRTGSDGAAPDGNGADGRGNFVSACAIPCLANLGTNCIAAALTCTRSNRADGLNACFDNGVKMSSTENPTPAEGSPRQRIEVFQPDGQRCLVYDKVPFASSAGNVEIRVEIRSGDGVLRAYHNAGGELGDGFVYCIDNQQSYATSSCIPVLVAWGPSLDRCTVGTCSIP
jgi:hypothetical protein